MEGAAEGGTDNWGEVVTREPYRKVRLDHLLSKEEEVVVCVLLFSYQEITEKFPVAMRFGDTPVPIPNTTVKTEAADDTMLETAWESRWLPDP